MYTYLSEAYLPYVMYRESPPTATTVISLSLPYLLRPLTSIFHLLVSVPKHKAESHLDFRFAIVIAPVKEIFSCAGLAI
jgi:hypothetical protein